MPTEKRLEPDPAVMEDLRRRLGHPATPSRQPLPVPLPATIPGLPMPNTTPTPDVFFDEIAPTLNEGELRVMLYLIRRTYGFKKLEDRVSIAQFCTGIKHRAGAHLDRGTGMHHKSVIRALASLEKRALIEAHKDTSDVHGGNDVTLYRLRMEGGV